MNKVFEIGRLTKAPEVRETPNGKAVATFSIAVPRRMNREETDYFDIVAWRGLAENCGKYLVKGQRVAVVGELRNRTYQVKDGTNRHVTEIVAEDVEFLDRPNGAQGGSFVQHAQPKDEFAAEMSAEAPMYDDDLPF